MFLCSFLLVFISYYELAIDLLSLSSRVNVFACSMGIDLSPLHIIFFLAGNEVLYSRELWSKLQRERVLLPGTGVLALQALALSLAFSGTRLLQPLQLLQCPGTTVHGSQ